MKLLSMLNLFAGRSSLHHTNGSSQGCLTPLDTPENVGQDSRSGLVPNGPRQWREGGELPPVYDIHRGQDFNPYPASNIPAGQLYRSLRDLDKRPSPTSFLTGTTPGLNSFPSLPPSTTLSPSTALFHSTSPSRSVSPTPSILDQDNESELGFPLPTYDGKSRPLKARYNANSDWPEALPLVNSSVRWRHRTVEERMQRCCRR